MYSPRAWGYATAHVSLDFMVSKWISGFFWISFEFLLLVILIVKIQLNEQSMNYKAQSNVTGTSPLRSAYHTRTHTKHLT